jgi:hypothetical protein
MQRLVAQKSNVGVLTQEIMDRCSAGFLDAGHDETDARNFPAFEKTHDKTVTTFGKR